MPSPSTPGGPPTHGHDGGSPSGPSLPSTGSSVSPVLMGFASAVLLAGGGLVVMVVRRRGRHS
ncbi:LPXTG cell wall anchor domain-containing protein [Kitasatospora indigofera]|uniref:LPXTG cell wall anchor domain-containing protein n=1 Tax=Kitasatospora indigofera TaxID=67307 RepID=UPI003666FBFC